MHFPTSFFKATEEYNTYEKHIPAPCIRKKFKAREFKHAYITVTGLGFYELFLNGERITKGLLAPYISNPDDIIYFDRYDVSEKLCDVNVIGLILGNGMQNAPGGRVWDFDKAGFRSAPCFAMSITYVDADGIETIIDADKTFRWHSSAIIFDDLRSGCFYDANLEMEGWLEQNYDDSEWNYVITARKPNGECRICEASKIVVTEEVKPVEIKPCRLMEELHNREDMRPDTQFKFNKLGEEGILFDFGINAAGIFRLKINGRKQQRVFIQFAEHMRSDGVVSYGNTGAFYPDGYGQTALYICKGEENEVFEPFFTYYGYRYAVVFGLEESQLCEDTLTMLVANADLKERAGFTCSDETMNKLGDMAKRSDLSNFFYFPTDCPHREKNGWTGDAAVSAEHYLLTLDVEKSLTEWLRNICVAQRENGELPGIIPTAGWGFEWGNGPAWDNALTELCFQIYRFRGDLEPAKECAQSIYRYLKYISDKRRADGLVAIGLGDWLQPGRRADSPDAPLHITDSVMVMYIAQKSWELFCALGMTDYAEYAKELRASVKASIREHCIDFSTMTVGSGCQTAQAICIYYGVFEPSEQERACNVLIKLVHEKADHFDCGMIGMRVIFHVLSACGQGNLAYKMITRKDYPSYGMLINQGLTTLPESFLPPEKWDSPDSLNHHFMGDITSWFISKVVGICVNPELTSPNYIVVEPDFIEELDFAEAFYKAPAGKIKVRWERKNGKITVYVTHDKDITIKVNLTHNRDVTVKVNMPESYCVNRWAGGKNG